MKRLLAALILAASPAAALTCVPPSIEMAFTAAQKVNEIYVPVMGTFSGFRQRAATKTINGADRKFSARFIGLGITASGNDAALDVPVKITETCLGSFCPAFAPDQVVLTFLARDGSGYALQVNACYGNIFADPSPAQIDTLRGCLKSMTCIEN